jgi:predicted HTH transcriptional regulator
MIFKESEKAELKKSTAELKDALKDILQKSISVLRNPGIAEVLFLAGYIERWGSGVKKMNGLMEEYGLSKPVYEEISGNFLVTFKRKKILIRKKLETKTVPSLS